MCWLGNRPGGHRQAAGWCDLAAGVGETAGGKTEERSRSKRAGGRRSRSEKAELRAELRTQSQI